MRRTFGSIGLYLALMLLVLLVAACAPAPAAPAATTAADTEEASGIADQIVFATSGDVVTLDPQNMTDNTSQNVTGMIYNNLIAFDEELNILPDLAESWSVSEDEKVWTFNLRSGVTFHDGTPFDATSVKKSFDRVLDPQWSLARTQLFDMIKEVRVVDESTVEIETNEPFGAFPATIAHGAAAIVQADYALEIGKDEYQMNPIGTGPYKFVSWRKDQDLIIERNDDYWGEKGVTPRIVFMPIPEAATRVTALETGAVDAIVNIPDPDLVRLLEDPNFVMDTVTSNGQRQFRFNLTKEPFDNVLVRQAISHAIDRDLIVESLFANTAIPSTGALSPVTWGHHYLGTVPYDPEKAKALLAEAGYPDGFEMTISTTERYTQGREVAEVLAAQLAEIGIKATIDVMEWGTIRAQWGGLTPEEMELEFFIMGAGPSTGDADWGLRPIFLTPVNGTNENNYGFYSNAEFDELILEAMRTTDPDTRLELYKRAQEIVYLEDPAALWLYDYFFIVGHKKELKDITMSPLGLVTFEKAYLEQ
jgi:peptide/nickel transport system substrate-binding protein